MMVYTQANNNSKKTKTALVKTAIHPPLVHMLGALLVLVTATTDENNGLPSGRRVFFSANGTRALDPIECPIATRSTFLVLSITSSTRGDEFTAALARRLQLSGIPWLAFGDERSKPPLIPLEQHEGEWP